MEFAPDPLVTIVIATYGRDAVLQRALESARRQSEARWTALVVGDGCGPQTRDAVLSLADARIRFVNLPARQGEQSRPNSVGMALATTSLIAFLNQDDLWLPDHLERALAAIGRKADFYAGSAAFAHRSGPAEDGVVRPLFSERTPLQRELIDAYSSAGFVFEPVSSWVITKRLAERLGPWRSAFEIRRGPLQEWVLRAARAGSRFTSDPHITTLKVNTHHESGAAHEYERGTNDHDVLLGLIDRLGSDGMRSLIDDDLAFAMRRGLPPRDPALAFGPGAQAEAGAHVCAIRPRCNASSTRGSTSSR